MSRRSSRPAPRTGWLLGAAGLVAAVAFFVLRAGAPSGGAGPAARSAAHPEDAPGFDAGPTAAGAMVDRLQRFRSGAEGGRIELDGPHLTSLIRHAMPGVIPDGVSEPSVYIVDGVVRVHAHVSPGVLPGGRHLVDALETLPESVDVELRGLIANDGVAWVVYRVDEVLVEGVELPRPVVALVVGAIQNREGAPGGARSDDDPPGAGSTDSAAGEPVLRLRWAAELGIVRVGSDRVVIERVEPLPAQAVDGSGGA